jgi:hypothetical protein
LLTSSCSRLKLFYPIWHFNIIEISLSSVIGYSIEQFDRVSNALISLLSHNEADYRLIAATNLANLRKETKSIDIALLNSFINDSRV